MMIFFQGQKLILAFVQIYTESTKNSHIILSNIYLPYVIEFQTIKLEKTMKNGCFSREKGNFLTNAMAEF